MASSTTQGSDADGNDRAAIVRSSVVVEHSSPGEPATVSRETMLDSDVDDAAPRRALQLRLQRDEVHQRLFGEPALESHRIGRYLVLGTLGQGGMGTVLRAHDETLGRDVALKVLHDLRGGRHEKRLLREAQALARLTHRNVVRVYDVQEIDGRLCMAMELVHGHSLDTWQLEPRPWSEVLEVYRQAGRGLAAAHAEGLVHRDFKPANCILDAEGVVKVLDFGLARGVGADVETPAIEAEQTQHSQSISAEDSVRASRSQRMLDQAITRTGTMLGTLSYMAPEQLMGQPAAPASDQFSFCVALYEALFGVRPFGGVTAMTILYAIQSAVPDARSSRKGLPPVPKWLVEVLRRGLSVATHQRFESMESLLAALERQLVRRRRVRRGAVGIALAGTLGGALAISGAFTAAQPCDGLREAPMPAWSSDDHRAVRAAFEGSGLPNAEDVHARVEEALDAYATAWTEARAEACEATWVRREAGEQALSRRMACLDDRLPHLRATVDELASADARTAAHAGAALADLPSLEPCMDAELLLRGPAPLPLHLAEDAARIRELIARSWASGATGHDDGGLEAAERAVDAARNLEQAPLLELEALHNRGHLYRRARRLADARVDLGAALALAEGLDDQVRAADVLRELILVADLERDLPAADAWLMVIRGKLDRQDDQPIRQAQRWELEARVALRGKRLDEALSASEKAVALYEGLSTPEPGERVEALLLRGSVLRQLGDMTGSRHSYQAALDLARQENLLPMLGRVEYRLAYLDYAQGELDPAETRLRASLQDYEAYFGAITPASVRTHLLLAQILRMQGSTDDALEQASIAERSADERTSAQLRGELANLRGSLHRALDQWDEALEAYREARVAWQTVRSPDRVYMAMLDSNIADCMVHKGDLAAAAPLYDGSVAILEVETSSDHPARAYPLLGRARLALAQGQPEIAVPLLRRVLGQQAAIDRDPSLKASAQWALSRALRPNDEASDEATAEAVELALKARAAFVEARIDHAAEVDAWLERCGSACAQDPSTLTQR